MLRFKQFVTEEAQKDKLSNYPVLYNFLHHLSAPSLQVDKEGINEDIMNEAEKTQARPIEDIKHDGAKNQPSGNLFHHIRNGFHAAFPENEDPKETKQKALESQKHFRKFMHERGGHAAKNNLSLTGENGKTKLSSGENVQTIGLALAPHTSSGLNKFNTCPKASTECREGCLGFTAGGNKRYPETAFRSKLLRTQYVAEHPEHAGRLLSKEIGENEKWSDKHGYKSGFRGNVTSDLPYEHLMPKKFFEKHHKTQFYDYTKIAARAKNKDLPDNYHLTLSHTGTGHSESNDKDVVKHLENGGVVAMVHQKSKVKPTHVMDMSSGKKYPIVSGDESDNTFDRHREAGLEQSKLGHGVKGQGVVSGLKLKGITNEKAGKFANPVDDDGIIRINHPKPE